MSLYLLYPLHEGARLANGRNVLVIRAATKAKARLRAESIAGMQQGECNADAWTCEVLNSTGPEFFAETKLGPIFSGSLDRAGNRVLFDGPEA